MRARWYITEDKLEKITADKGSFIICGGADPRWESEGWYKEDGTKTIVTPFAHKFRMLDDDGIVYYVGYCEDGDSEEAFNPLDDYGMPNDGCTEIQYWENGKWETL